KLDLRQCHLTKRWAGKFNASRFQKERTDVPRHEEFAEGCKAACNGYDTLFLKIFFRL
uniref:Uncharacterized protein n=1 Tax=Theropithecus gelada TaxID=9565 RepID=A0A8D2FXH3_THEGE